MEKSPEEEENQYLSDKRINELHRKSNFKVWLAAIPAGIGAGVAGYFNQLWLLLITGALVVWILLRKR
jgi:uncharacterized membrane protein